VGRNLTAAWDSKLHKMSGVVFGVGEKKEESLNVKSFVEL